ncbi:MAG: phytanoyl-CoA dioxygenase family protein [Bdellovibrionales bacterium]
MVAGLKPIPKDLPDTVLNQSYWESFAPDLTISDQKTDTICKLDDRQAEKSKARLIKEGYTHLEQPGLDTPLTTVTNTFQKMVDLGIPPVFSFVYDEMWNINLQIRGLIKTYLDDADIALMPDFWAWHVSPGQAGWTPHRDKYPFCLFPDAQKRPKSLTAWIPLTIARPLNGCMYILPADRDKNYGRFNQKGENMPPPVNAPDIRALPGEAGDVFVWTQHVFHWGSHSADEHDLPPRMSVAFEYQRLDIETIYNEPAMPVDIMPSFEQRLALIAKQVQQYTHMYQFGEDLIALAEKIAANTSLPDTLEATGEAVPEHDHPAAILEKARHMIKPIKARG